MLNWLKGRKIMAEVRDGAGLLSAGPPNSWVENCTSLRQDWEALCRVAPRSLLWKAWKNWSLMSTGVGRNKRCIGLNWRHFLKCKLTFLSIYSIQAMKLLQYGAPLCQGESSPPLFWPMNLCFLDPPHLHNQKIPLLIRWLYLGPIKLAIKINDQRVFNCLFWLFWLCDLLSCKWMVSIHNCFWFVFFTKWIVAYISFLDDFLNSQFFFLSMICKIMTVSSSALLNKTDTISSSKSSCHIQEQDSRYLQANRA